MSLNVVLALTIALALAPLLLESQESRLKTSPCATSVWRGCIDFKTHRLLPQYDATRWALLQVLYQLLRCGLSAVQNRASSNHFATPFSSHACVIRRRLRRLSLWNLPSGIRPLRMASVLLCSIHPWCHLDLLALPLNIKGPRSRLTTSNPSRSRYSVHSGQGAAFASPSHHLRSCQSSQPAVIPGPRLSTCPTLPRNNQPAKAWPVSISESGTFFALSRSELHGPFQTTTPGVNV